MGPIPVNLSEARAEEREGFELDWPCDGSSRRQRPDTNLLAGRGNGVGHYSYVERVRESRIRD